MHLADTDLYFHLSHYGKSQTQNQDFKKNKFLGQKAKANVKER
jgi:hypothetical protein